MWDPEFEKHKAWMRYRQYLVQSITGGLESHDAASEEARTAADEVWKKYVKGHARFARLEEAYVLAATEGTQLLLSEMMAQKLEWERNSHTKKVVARLRDPN